MASVEEQRKIGQAKAARLEDRVYSPEEEEYIHQLALEYIKKYVKKDAKKGS